MKLSKSFIITIGLFLGIVVLVNMFSIYENIEGFQEGNTSRPSVKSQVCDAKSCPKSKSAIDKWFNGKKVSDTSQFFNATTGGLLTKPSFPFALDKTEDKNKSCLPYIQCQANNLVASESSASESSPAPAPSAPAPSGDSSSNTAQIRAALDSAEAAINSAQASIK
jgi:hypothetical protein